MAILSAELAPSHGRFRRNNEQAKRIGSQSLPVHGPQNNSRTRAVRWKRRCPCRRRVVSTIRGCPATVENRRPKLLTNSRQVVAETFSRSKMGGTGAADGVEPRWPGIVWRAVQSSNSR